jgi:cytochrome b subunit of formate dehydrogenase
MKSKSMQKVSKENSLVEKYKKALRIYAVVFAIVFLLLYVTFFNLAVAWTFLYMISLLVIT